VSLLSGQASYVLMRKLCDGKVKKISEDKSLHWSSN
jgi:hypothetical protein